MPEIPDIELGGEIDPLLTAIIVQLIRVGVFDGKDIAAVSRRAKIDPVALQSLFIEAMLNDSPEAIRSGLHVVPNGGNEGG